MRVAVLVCMVLAGCEASPVAGWDAKQTVFSRGGDTGGLVLMPMLDACPVGFDDVAVIHPEGAKTCVHTGATVLGTYDPGVVIGDGAYIAEGAHLGADSVLGELATLGERAVVGVDSEIGARTVVSRTARVGDRTVLGPDTSLGRAAVVGSDVSASAGGLSVGYASSLGDRCVVSGENVTLGSLVTVGADCELGANTVLARSVTLGDGAALGAGVVIGPDVIAGAGLTVGDGVRMRKRTTAGLDVMVGEGASIGRDSVLGDNVSIGSDATLRSNVQVGNLGTVSDDAFVDRGTVVDGVPIDPCTQAFGVSCAEFEWDYLKASNTDSGDQFGYAVALSGDTLAVGTIGERSSATGVNGDQTSNDAPSSGAVYVFTRSAGVWSQQAYVKASNTDRDDRFGGSVALSGDTLVVGASWEDSSATGVNGDESLDNAGSSGPVYVYARSGSVWSQQAYLKASNAAANDHFGYSVALSGDTLAVGARWQRGAATGINGDEGLNVGYGRGAVYVFTRSSGIWSQQAYIKASNTDENDFFGGSVALSGDTLAVGADREGSAATGVNGDQSSNAAPLSGAVYVFTRDAGVWSQQAYVKASNTDENDHFGGSVSLYGDTLAVGAIGERSSATGVNGDQSSDGTPSSGAVYVFTHSAGIWSQQAYLKASNPVSYASFGISVALYGDRLAVGANSENSAATGVNGDQSSEGVSNSGAAYLFERSAGTWSQQVYLKASNTGPGDRFGSSVALSGDTFAGGAHSERSAASGVDGDQNSDAAINSGSVYVTRAP